MTQKPNSNQGVNIEGSSEGSQIGQAGRNLTQTVIYNYYYEKHTVTTSTEDDMDDNLICPYQGLYHFNLDNSEYFFGREVFVEELYQYTETRNFIPVLGASGSGKSSVILAGLVPRLIQAGRWQFTHFRPGSDPFLALAQALVPLYEPNLDQTDGMAAARKLSGYFQDNTICLLDVFTTIQRNHSQERILLIADQFEELYTLCSDEKIRFQFIDTLLQTFQKLAEQSPPSIVLVETMRADFLGNALSYRPLVDVLQKNDIKLGPMNSDELRDVIKKPAEKLGVSFESGLVERILEDVNKEPGNLPLLEFALTELWKKRKGKQLTHDAYQEIGEVSGALTRYADDKFSQLKPEEKEQVRHIFVQLVHPGAGTEDTRRVATKAELSESDWNVVKKLADQRLVVTSRTVLTREIIENSQPQSENRLENTTEQEEQETVEVVHEALIRNWGQLRGWMEIDREFRSWQERLRSVKKQWEDMNRDQGSLLRGAALAEAEERLQERPEDLIAEKIFIEASIQERDRLEQEKTAQRQREIRTAWNIAVGSLVAVVVSTGLGGFAFLQYQIANQRKQEADKQSKIALARELATQANLEGNEGNLQEFSYLDTSSQEFTFKIGLDSSLDIWTTDLTLIKTFKGHEDLLITTAFSPDGRYILTGSQDKTLKLWRTSGELISSLNHQDVINSASFSPDGQYLVTASQDQFARIWNVNAELICSLRHDRPVRLAVFSFNGKNIVTVSGDTVVKFFHFSDCNIH